MAREAFEAMYSDLHEARPFHDGSFASWAKERSREHPYGAHWGHSIDASLTDVTPWDDFTTKANASPVPPESVAEQAPRK